MVRKQSHLSIWARLRPFVDGPKLGQAASGGQAREVLGSRVEATQTLKRVVE